VVFERKKLNTETLSEYLKEVRQRLGFSLEVVAEKTAIQPKFLKALEDGRFGKLPPDVYVLGFLRRLSALYGIEAKMLVDQYRKEKVIQVNILKQRENVKPWLKKVFDHVVINPKTVSLGVGVIFVLATLGYLIWAVSSINRAPSLEIFSPQDREVVSGSSVMISGRTDPGMSVTINQQNVFVDSDGNFQSQVGLNAGPKELVVVAKNKFDKTVTKTITVIGEDDIMSAADASVNLELRFSGDVTLTYTIDGGGPQTENFYAGDTKEISGKSKVVISTTDAGATRVVLNGQDLGAMGRAGERLDNIPFTAESVSG